MIRALFVISLILSASGGFVKVLKYIPYTSHYHYYCRDHLGNNRVVVGEEGGIAEAKAEMVKKKLEKSDD